MLQEVNDKSFSFDKLVRKALFFFKILNKILRVMRTLLKLSHHSFYISENISQTGHIWATSWENMFMPYANNKGVDQPVHLCSLISTFVVHCLHSIIPLVSITKISSFYLASVAAQAGLCLTWSQTPKTGFLVTRLILHLNYIAFIHLG